LTVILIIKNSKEVDTMSIFSKAVYRDIELPFMLYESEEYNDFIDIEAYGDIDGEYKYFLSSYEIRNTRMYDSGDFEQMKELLKNSDGKTVAVRLKYKNGKLKNFKLDTESLVKVYNDERFRQLELLSWGLNDESIAVLEKDTTSS